MSTEQEYAGDPSCSSVLRRKLGLLANRKNHRPLNTISVAHRGRRIKINEHLRSFCLISRISHDSDCRRRATLPTGNCLLSIRFDSLCSYICLSVLLHSVLLCFASHCIASHQPSAGVSQHRVPFSHCSPAPDHSQFQERPLQYDGSTQEEADRQDQ